MERGTGLTPTIKDNIVRYRGYIIPAYNPYNTGAAALPGTSLEMTTSAGGGRGGDAHKFEKSLISFYRYELSCKLHHVDAKSEESTEGLKKLL